MRTFVTSLIAAAMMTLLFSIAAFAAPAPACQMRHGDTTYSVALFSALLVAQETAAADLTTLSDSDVSAYRWQAMAKFYAPQADLIDLTTLNDGDISAYRWEAMARFYAGQPAQAAMIAP